MLEVKKVMTTRLITVRPEDNVLLAAELLLRFHISGLPVVNENYEPVGIITEKDILGLIKTSGSGEREVADYMTVDIKTFNENDSILDVCDYFQENSIRRVPIVSKNRLVGVVSRRDLIREILRIRQAVHSVKSS